MPTPEPSSTTFANDPIVNLLRKPLNQMTESELRAYSKEVRLLATSPQALGKKLRQDEFEKAEKRQSATPAQPKKSFDDMMKEFETP